MKPLTLAGVLVVACMATGCSDKTGQQAREAGQQAAEAAKAAGAAVESAAEDAVRNAEHAKDTVAAASVEHAGQTARAAVDGAADAANAAVQTAQVKAALVADSAVEAAGINVDTDARTKTIVLKGHVPSEAQKTAAAGIARAKAAAGYTVRNELVVRAPAR